MQRDQSLNQGHYPASLTKIVSLAFAGVLESWYLCSEVNCLYISNAKLINLWETAVSLFVFLALLVESALILDKSSFDWDLEDEYCIFRG